MLSYSWSLLHSFNQGPSDVTYFSVTIFAIFPSPRCSHSELPEGAHCWVSLLHCAVFASTELPAVKNPCKRSEYHTNETITVLAGARGSCHCIPHQFWPQCSFFPATLPVIQRLHKQRTEEICLGPVINSRLQEDSHLGENLLTPKAI